MQQGQVENDQLVTATVAISTTLMHQTCLGSRCTILAKHGADPSLWLLCLDELMGDGRDLIYNQSFALVVMSI